MRDLTRVYATHGRRQMLGVKAMINGKLCMAYMKGDELIAYEPWEDLQRQMLSGPCRNIELDQPTTC